MGKKKTFLAGYAYVDSGMIHIGDPGYLLDDNAPDWDRFCGAVTDGKHGADGEEKLPEGQAAEPLGKGMGLAFKPGLGDGLYPVHITIEDDGHISSAFILFDQ